MQTELDNPAAATRIQRLKAMTDATHDRLEKRIMAAQPFSSKERYALFLDVQHGFHADVAPLYASPELNRLLPGLADRCRFKAIKQDIRDVTGNEPAAIAGRNGELDLPTALGWVYVAEGSNLGAAFLLKEAIKLGLSEDAGARHLAGHPDGRGLHWRNFVSAYNALPMTEADELKVAEGAKAAFNRVHALVEETFA